MHSAQIGGRSSVFGARARAKSVSAWLVVALVPIALWWTLRDRLDGGSQAASITGDRAAIPPEERLWVNSIGTTLVWVPPGEFRMGSAPGEFGRDSDERLHRVCLTRPFYVGVREVTVGQFGQFVRETGYLTDGEREPWGCPGYGDASSVSRREYSWRQPGFPQTDECPVVNVSWNDATAFCRWLADRESRPYRLPTEAEWEYTCRAGGENRTLTEEDVAAIAEVANVRDLWKSGRPPASPVVVDPLPEAGGAFPANAFGIDDMLGNVCEWCFDTYVQDPPREATDPVVQTGGEARVIRGGSFFLSAIHARPANRIPAPPFYRNYGTGFRVAMSCAVSEGEPVP